MQVAGELGAEILSCDSVQVYRGFAIGCAKPTVEERGQVFHHLIDVVEWHELFDAAAYRRAARETLRVARASPVLVGGTGLYLRALRYGLIDTPPADASLRAALEARERDAPGSLYRELARVDPATAQVTEPLNLVRIVRALEIYRHTGDPPSQLRAAHRLRGEEVPMQVVALQWPRDVLRRRIQERAAQMLRAGLVEEVRALLAAGVAATCRPMQSVGYRQVIEGLAAGEGEAALAQAITKATWSYARRQMTWFKKEAGVTWLELASEQDIARRVGELMARDTAPGSSA